MPARRQSGVSPVDPATGLPVEGGRGRGKEGKEKETFACPFPGCGQNYSRMEYLKRHQRKHQDDRPFQCKDCTKAFARSDVLLRHRRRCHPTPPPTDRNSHSPPAPHRNYPGVPISSSRTDARDASPARPPRGRKHNRPSGPSEDREANRPRIDPSLDPSLEDDFGGEGSDRFGEDGQFGRHNGMGNGGVYSATSDFYGPTGLPDGASYTPHLSMFQQNQSYHNMNESEHLEDASVLLSMAYPGGVPARDDPDAQKDLPDWANNPTINMMMEAAVAANREEAAAHQTTRNGSTDAAIIPVADDQSATLNGTTEQRATQNLQQAQVSTDPVVDPALASTEPLEGNFLNAMSWLSGMDSEGVSDPKKTKEKSTLNSVSTSTPSSNNNDSTQEESSNNVIPNGWMQLLSSMTPNTSSTSPFPLSSLFSPSTVGMLPFPLSDTNDANKDGTTQAPSSSPTVMSIINQLAMYDVPQTLTNPNPERPLLRVESAGLYAQAGPEFFDKNSPFYLPAERFSGCYQIPHWGLPPLRTLSVMACRTFHTVLNHFSFVHMPTFKLVDTAACLAFAICTVGGIRTDSSSSSDKLLFQAMGYMGPVSPKTLDGPVVPDQSWESMYEQNWNNSRPDKSEDAQRVRGWKSGTLVRSEKTNMLVKSFSLAHGVLMTEYNVALLQSLILYHAPNFLSENESERHLANMTLGTIVNITRQVGFFTPEADHISPIIRTPIEPFTPNELDRCWREWIQLETRRRTAFLVYQLDTVSALEANITCILSSCELSFIPLPAPDSLWKAPTAWEWLKAVKTYRPMSLDEAMRRTFFLPAYGAFDALHEQADSRFYNILNTTELGPFARLVLVLTLLRGVIDIGEGRRDRGDWRDLTDLWVGCSWLRPSKKIVDQDGKDLGFITRESLRGRFTQALQKWREGWDFDKLCDSPGAAKIRRTDSKSPDGVSPDSGFSGSSGKTDNPESELPKETFSYYEDALPFYWLAVALINHLNTSPPRPIGYNLLSGLKYSEMLKAARTFTRMGEGVPGVPSAGLSPSTARQGSGLPGASGSSVNPNSSSNSPQVAGSTSTVSGSSTSSDLLATSTTVGDEDADVNTMGMDIPAMSPGTVEGFMEALGGAEMFEAFAMGSQGGVLPPAPATNGGEAGRNVLAPGNGNGNGSGVASSTKSAADRQGVIGGGVAGQGDLAEHLGFIY